MAQSRVMWAGVLLLAGGVVFVVGLPIAESLYPGYSVNANLMSDLGATCRYPPAEPMPCVIQQPASAFFTVVVLGLGSLSLASALLLFARVRAWWFALCLALFGVGAIGAAVFNETVYPAHGWLGLVAFVFGALAALAAFWTVRGWMRVVSLALGAFAFVAIVLDVTIGGYATGAGSELPIGMGGMERLCIYPTVIWLVGLGAVLMAAPELLKTRAGDALESRGSAARPVA